MSEHYSTSDFYLAVFLKSQGILLAGLTRQGRRTIFNFDLNGQKQLVFDFYNNKALVKVNDFVHAERDIRSLIHNDI